MYEPENDAAKAKVTDPVLIAAQETVKELAEPLKEKIVDVAKVQKDAGADQMRLLARAMQGASQAVEGDVPQFAGYMKDLSAKLDQAADDVQERELGELGQAASDFAKRNPALVFGGAIVAGLSLARFLKSSGQSSSSSSERFRQGDSW